MKTRIVGLSITGLAGLFWAVNMAPQAQAYPSRGGNCAYCHSEDGGELDVSGFDLLEIVEGEELKTFTVAPGGSTQFTLTAVEKGIGEYGIILNRLDLLNEEVQYTPRLYTPDPDWSSSRSGREYLYGYGRYYSTGLSEELEANEFDLTLDPTVKPGLYTLEAQMAGGYPSAGEGWHTVQLFGLRVMPEPTALVLMLTGLSTLGLLRGRRRRA